jgi:hypothetical protein
VTATLDAPTEVVEVADHGGERGCPDLAWSNDGTLAFVDRAPDESPEQLYLFIYRSNSIVRRFALAPGIAGAGDLTWSADAGSVAYESNQGVRILSAVDGSLIRTVNGERPRFSPTDETVLAVVDRAASKLVLMDGTRRLASLPIPSADGGYAWSPDGTRIAVDLADRIGAWSWRSGDLAIVANLPRDSYLQPWLGWVE